MFILILSVIGAVASARHFVSLYTRMDTTEEGYWVIATKDHMVLTDLCGPTDGGCSFWDQDKPMPTTSCLIVVYEGKGAPAPIEEILVHERRHCREGFWHDLNGRALPATHVEATLGVY